MSTVSIVSTVKAYGALLPPSLMVFLFVEYVKMPLDDGHLDKIFVFFLFTTYFDDWRPDHVLFFNLQWLLQCQLTAN